MNSNSTLIKQTPCSALAEYTLFSQTRYYCRKCKNFRIPTLVNICTILFHLQYKKSKDSTNENSDKRAGANSRCGASEGRN